MNTSPFKFGTVVTSMHFVNRETEKTHLINNFKNSINTIILSPRRWGKSSLVKEASRLCNDEYIKFCFIDMLFVRNEEEFYTVYAKEVLKQTSSKFEEVIATSKEFFKQLIPKITFSADFQNEFSIGFDWNEIKKNRDEILNLPEKIALKKGIKIVICIDEFQDMKNFKDSVDFEKTLRSCWQLHQNVSYCLYGSKRHLINEIFNKKSNPFYRFGDIFPLKKIAKEHWVPFLINKFNEYSIDISNDLASLIVDKVSAHPYYVQQLAYNVWTFCKDSVTVEVIEEAMQQLFNSNQILFEKELESLSNTQVNMLKAIVNGETQLTSANVMNNYKLGTPRNVSKNRDILEKKDIIDFSEKNYTFVDPIFEAWIKNEL